LYAFKGFGGYLKNGLVVYQPYPYGFCLKVDFSELEEMKFILAQQFKKEVQMWGEYS